MTLAGREGAEKLAAFCATLESYVAAAAMYQARGTWIIVLAELRAAMEPLFAPSMVFELQVLARKFAAESTTTISARKILELQTDRPSEQLLVDVDRLMGSVALLQFIGVILRRVEKGQTFRLPNLPAVMQIGNVEDFLTDEVSQKLEAAITRYDQRCAADPSGAGMLGTTGVARPGEPGDEDSVVIWIGGSRSACDWFDPEQDDPWYAYMTNIRESFPVPYQLGRAQELRVHLMAATLNTVWGFIVVNGQPGPWSHLGFVILPEVFYQHIRDMLIEYGHQPHDVDREMSATPSISRAGAAMLVDLVGATNELHASHFRTRDGSEANMWGAQFEIDVQSLIDSTPWAPPASLRHLIGKKIKRDDGSELTDIDAVAYRDGVLLLLDGKSYQLTFDVSIGRFSAIRNMSQRVEKASAKWADNIEYIRERIYLVADGSTPVRQIEGLVVLPAPPFVHDGQATETVLGNHRAISVDELRAFLNTPSK